MKKKLLLIFFIILSFASPVLRVNASGVPLALITTIYDSNTNDNFWDAQIIEEEETNVSSPDYKNSYIGGIIKTASDVDYFCLNSFSCGTILLQLTMLDTSYTNTYNYNFEIYEHQNGNNVTRHNNYMNLLYSSTTLGTNEYYRFECKATSYFIKIYSADGTYSSRNSYKLSYSQYKPKTSYDMQQYIEDNAEGFAIWESDFKIAGGPNVVVPYESEFYFGYTFSGDDIYHDVTKKFYEYGEFPSFELYFWGPQTRMELYDFLTEFIDSCYDKIDAIDNKNGVKKLYTRINKIGDQILFVLDIFISGLGIVSNITIEVTDYVLAYFGISVTPESTDSLYELIIYLSSLKTAIVDLPDTTTDDNYLFMISHKNSIIKSSSSMGDDYYQVSNFDGTGCRYYLDFRYSGSNYIYDVKEYDNNQDGTYDKIYGKCYFDNINQRLKTLFGYEEL